MIRPAAESWPLFITESQGNECRFLEFQRVGVFHRIVELRQIEPEFLERMFSVEDI